MIKTNPSNERKHSRLALPAIATMLLLSGCSERHSAQAPSTAPTSVATQPESPSTVEDPGNVVKGAFAPGGLATTYEAHFQGNQLQRINEQRKTADGAAAGGEYGFYGARLMQYQGVALQSDARLELKFDMQGSVTAANSSAGKVSDEEISGIRNRAQMLRSHAVARRGTQGHAG
jgi:hypothetical protein